MTGRVLMLSQAVHCIPPLTGAAVEQWIDAVAHRLTAWEGYVVSVPHPHRPDDESDGAVHYHRIRVGRVYRRLFQKLTRLDPWSYADRVVAYAKEIRPDIIHVHNAPHFVDALRKGVPDAKLVLHMHNEKKTSFVSPVERFVGCSEYIAEWFRARGVPAKEFATLPNGVDTERFTPRPERLPEIAGRFGIPNDRFVVTYVGRISPEKGPDLLVEALRRLPAERYHLVVVGEWPKGDARSNDRVAYADSLRQALAGLPATVIGDFPPDAMPDIYRLGDLLVIPSRFEEPFSMVAIEGMASGLPVLALRRGGMAEYMVDGGNARVLDPDCDASGLAAAIAACAEDVEGSRCRARAARAMVEERFTWGQVAAATEALYDQLRSGNGRQGA